MPTPNGIHREPGRPKPAPAAPGKPPIHAAGARANDAPSQDEVLSDRPAEKRTLKQAQDGAD